MQVIGDGHAAARPHEGGGVQAQGGGLFAYELLGRSTHPDLPASPMHRFSLATRLNLEAEISEALDELRMALATLPEEQREALILVGAGGFAYEEAAEICQCAVGTVKSRVSRARRALLATLENTPNVAVQWFDAAGRIRPGRLWTVG